ncbi:MAG: alpha-galactosidase, partial [Solirubrobacteraceae bacterium]
VLEGGADEETGRVLALHLGWSGNHLLSVETQADGERQAWLGALMEPGEAVLPPGGEYVSPTAYACFSASGLTGVRASFHPFVRESILPARKRARRVHFNSWEGVYFDFDEEKLARLAEAAAALGVERFVLDDGWFMGRRSDKAGLGDWRVDPAVLPRGLSPLIDKVESLGMDFGLWVEPEMVNPDSDLYRAHPDWCAHAPGAERPTMRNQLWLDFSRSEVREHVVDQIDRLLSAHRIAYLKWDCNRTLFPAASQERPASLAIARGVYEAMDALRSRHPDLEIESCSSGGGRIDLEILRRTERVWASDTTDAIERTRIQRWASLILPPEVIGAHVGPSPNPITGRRIAMDFRAKVAMFGHMGVELDPARLDERDARVLKAHIELYKQHRALIHGGDLRCWTGDDGVDGRIA